MSELIATATTNRNFAYENNKNNNNNIAGEDNALQQPQVIPTSFYVKMKKVGRELTNIKYCVLSTIVKLTEYIQQNIGRLVAKYRKSKLNVKKG